MSTSRFIVCGQNGQVLRDYTGQSAPDIEAGQTIVDVGLDGDGTNYLNCYYDNGQFHELPPKPDSYYEFDYVNKVWFDPRTAETQWRVVRYERNNLLQESDWTDTYSAPSRLGQALYDQWQVYRQALRDVTDQPDPFNISWPVAPT